MMQRHEYIGNLTRDPEKHTTKSGKDFVRFSIAVNSPTGQKKTEYVAVSVFTAPLMKFVSGYLRKGSSVWVEGTALTASAWKKNDGTTVASLQLIANDVQGFGRAGIVGGGDGDAVSDAAEPVGGGNGSWEPEKYAKEPEEELPW